MSLKPCLQCGKRIEKWDKQCKYCGANQFGINNEYYPDAKAFRDAKKLMAGQQLPSRKQRKGFTDEEILATGLYPKDEGYKMSLISRILGRK